MGKKTRKTRWRTLPIADESDSEESNVTSSTQLTKSYHHRPYYSSKFTYSSQSTPTRRFPYESKSTRSSSTASETKITFNEDEYTKITTPRQDVLFKKGYLSKPKNYQTQTSTGNSTASTGNSTGNGTPDHQSADGTEGTDLEYESQFVFPNAFVDHNGICYINGYEHYPLVMYNPPICYPEYPLSRTKRHSTGSLTESTSPHTEETSQDLSQSGGENAPNGVTETNHVFNVVYPGYYFNAVCNSNVTGSGQDTSTEPRKIKKKRRRKISKSITAQEDGTTTVSSSEEEGYSSDEDVTQVENRVRDNNIAKDSEDAKVAENSTSNTRIEGEHQNAKNDEEEDEDSSGTTPDLSPKEEKDSTSPEDATQDDVDGSKRLDDNDSTQTQEPEEDTTKNQLAETNQVIAGSKFNLNAEEFVPRAYRAVETIAIDPNLHFVNVHPNFVPLPILNHPLNDMNPSSFNPQFLPPPGIPLNFLSADPKLLPNFVNFIPNQFIPPNKVYEQSQPPHNTPEHAKKDSTKENVEGNKEVAQEDRHEQGEQKEQVVEKDIPEEDVQQTELKSKIPTTVYKTEVDIAKIVSKLEEAAKEQKYHEDRRQKYRNSPNKFNKPPKQRFNSPYNNNYDKRKSVRRFDPPLLKQTEEFNIPKTQHTQSVQTKSEEIQTDSTPQTKTEIRQTEKQQVVRESPINEERKFSPRHQNYRITNSPRRYISYNNRNVKNKSTETSLPQLSRSVPSNTEYSETLKRPPNYSKSCPRFEKYNSGNNRTVPSITNRINNSKKIEETATESQKMSSTGVSKSSQWISVSNKKKRKNKSINEVDLDTTPADDVQEIVDASEMPEECANIEESVKDDQSTSIDLDVFIGMVRNTESLQEVDIPTGKIEMQDLKDVEKELLKDSVVIVEAVEEVVEIPARDVIKEVQNQNQIESVQQPAKTQIQKDAQRKKNKKSANKNSTKRIIIFDPDLSKPGPVIQRNITSNKVETPLPTPDDPKVVSSEEIVAEPEIIETTVSEESKCEPIEASSEDIVKDQMKNIEEPTPEKKKAKKKKKSNKTTNMSTSITSVSTSSSTTLNNAEDSYDFLLDTSALIDDKTNVEISEELDKMIQKGLFGNLEEKFRSLNVSVDDDFFRSLSLKPKTQATPEKGFIKATNFTTILNGANQNLSKMKTVEENDKIDVDFSKIKLPEYEPQPSTSKTGHFLDEVIQCETGPPLDATEDLGTSKSNGKLKSKSKKFMISENEDSTDEDRIDLGEEENDCSPELGDEQAGVTINLDLTEVEESKSNLNGVEVIECVKGEENVLEVTECTRNEEMVLEVTECTRNEGMVLEVTECARNEEIAEESFVPESPLKENGISLKNDDQLTIKIEDTSSELNEQKNISTTMRELNLNLEESRRNPDDTTLRDSIELKPFYPITEAVKEWMSKTRETTPDIELLKSPDTIYKEFLIEDNAEEDDSDTETEQKNLHGNPSPAHYLIRRITPNAEGGRVARNAQRIEEDAVTVSETWSMSEDASLPGEEDLLDCWESEIADDRKDEVPVEEGEDALESYERKYGKDEYFLKLKAELDDTPKPNDVLPKHTTLPYRAICCNLM